MGKHSQRQVDLNDLKKQEESSSYPSSFRQPPNNYANSVPQQPYPNNYPPQQQTQSSPSRVDYPYNRVQQADLNKQPEPLPQGKKAKKKADPETARRRLSLFYTLFLILLLLSGVGYLVYEILSLLA